MIAFFKLGCDSYDLSVYLWRSGYTPIPKNFLAGKPIKNLEEL